MKTISLLTLALLSIGQIFGQQINQLNIEKRPDQVHLSWKISSDRGGVFQVMRSEDGQNFSCIGKMKASDQGESHCYFVDQKAIKGGVDTLFYQVQLVQHNGLQSSFVQGKLCLNPSLVTYYLNHVATYLRIIPNTNAWGTYTICIRDIQGRIHQKHEMQWGGHPFLSGLDISALKPSVYILEIVHGTEKQVAKFWKR